MTLLNTLQDELKNAMKARDQKRLDALRQMVSAVRYAEVDSPNLSDEQIMGILSKEAKKRREAIAAYKVAGRQEQMEQEEYELGLIEEYLPTMMSEEEVRVKVQEVLNREQSLPAQAGISNIGMAMKAVMGELAGKADGGMVSKIVKELFGK